MLKILLIGDKWIRGMLKRHTELRLRKPSKITTGMVKTTEGFIRAWFNSMEQRVRDRPGCANIFEEPSRVLNSDESGFALNSAGGKDQRVLAMVGSRIVQKKAAGKTHITVQCTIAADGTMYPPMIISPGQREYPRATTINKDAFPEALYTSSANGWQTEVTFLKWIKRMSDWIDGRRVTKPVVIFIDGHSSHNGVDSLQFALDNGKKFKKLWCHLIVHEKCERRFFASPFSTKAPCTVPRGTHLC